MSQNSKPNRPRPQKLKILMLHGYTQSGPLFQAKTQRLKKIFDKSLHSLPIRTGQDAALISSVELFYLTGPTDVTSADVGGAEVRDKAHGWWTKRGQGYLCEGMDESIKMVAETLRQHGPIDGVIGFSQGAAFAAMVASLLENGRADAFAKVQGGMLFPESITELQHPPLKFGVCYSGLPMGHESYAGFYEPKIQTPLLHVMGSMDTIVEESQSLALAQRCEGGGEGLILRHAGNHAVPIGDRDISAVIQFIRDTFSPKNSSLKKEEDVLDMDMPF